MAIGISVLTAMPIAHAQYVDPLDPNAPATPEQLRYCKTHDIPAEQCTQNAILAKERVFIGPNPSPQTFDGKVFAMMLGSGVALVVGIFAVRKIRKVRKNTL